MKKNLINDERVVNEKRKIGNEAFLIIMFILIASILIQQYIFNASFSEYMTEFICFVGGAIYILIRNTSVGNTLIADKSRIKKAIITNSLVSTVTIVAIIGCKVATEANSIKEFLITLIIVVLVAMSFSVVSTYTIIKLNQRKVNKIEKELNDN